MISSFYIHVYYLTITGFITTYLLYLIIKKNRMKKIREEGIRHIDAESFKLFYKKNENKITDEDRLFFIAFEIRNSFDYVPFEIHKKNMDIILEKPINLNHKIEGTIPTLLFMAIYNASWDLFNYFVSKGADVYYKTDYKTHKNINCIEYAQILLHEIKTVELVDINNELQNLDRLNEYFINGQEEAEITMNEFYAIRQQTDLLKQIVFIDEFLRKFA